MNITERTFPDASVTGLFSVLLDPTTYPDWLTGAKHIREVSPDWPAPGSWFKHVVGFGPLAIPDRTSVVRVDPMSLLELIVRARPLLEARVVFTVTGAASGGSHLRVSEEPIGVFALTAPLTKPLIRARNERSLERLARVLDALNRV